MNEAADRPVLLTVSGEVPSDLAASVEAGRRSRADYVEMAQEFDALVYDRAAARRDLGKVGRVVGRLAGRDVELALACFRRRHRHRVVFTDGEQVGIPYAALTFLARRRPRHVMIGHRLSPQKKALVHRLLQLRRRIDAVVVYSTTQRRFAVEELGYPPERVVLSPFMVDTRFWDPAAVPPSPRPRPLVCAVGQELRDYPTLARAVEGLDADVVIAAVSPWSKRADTSEGIDVPANVTVGKFDLHQLRQLYADAALVVVPLQENDFQAGVTSILEAMSMGRAVVCSRTTGQTDLIVDGENGLYVPVGDVDALRAAITRLLDDPALADRLGAAARRWAIEHADVEAYATQLGAVVRTVGS